MDVDDVEEETIHAHEIRLIHEEVRLRSKSVLGSTAVIFGMLFVQQLEQYWWTIMVALICHVLHVLMNLPLLNVHTYNDLVKYHDITECTMLVLRAILNMWISVTNSGNTLLTLLALFTNPLAAARDTRRWRPFALYLAVHFLITVHHFRHDLMANLSYIIVISMHARVHLEVVSGKEEQHQARLKLAATNVRIQELGKSTTLNLLEGFCDAAVTLSADLRLLKPCARLEALLGRKAAKGRSFLELIDPSDLDHFESHMEQVRIDIAARSIAEDASDVGTERGETMSVQARSISVHLQDSYNQAIPMHLFHACFQQSAKDITTILGISESWQPKVQAIGQPGRSSNRRKHRTNVARFDITSGRLVPSAPAFTQADKDYLQPLETLARRSALSSVESCLATARSGSEAHRRPDSPIRRSVCGKHVLPHTPSQLGVALT
jgi:hypothetical protein